jgi:hypothetical protein
MMLGQIIQLPSDPKQKLRPFTTQILNPFGYRGKQYIDHDGLLYCYTIDGQARLVRSTRISTNGLQLNKKIKEVAPQINFVGMTPYRFVSPSGTTTWLFNVTSFGPGASILKEESQEVSLNKTATEILLAQHSRK